MKLVYMFRKFFG